MRMEVVIFRVYSGKLALNAQIIPRKIRRQYFSDKAQL